jgi:tight adherence protein B
VYPQGYRLEKEDTGSYEKEFMVSVDGEEPVSKRTGGDMNRVIQKVSRMLGDKIDVKKEIEATLAAKKSEQMIMSLMPVGIILYLQMTSPGFLSVLYGNPFGIAAMSICLVIYAAAYWLGRRIVDIEV